MRLFPLIVLLSLSCRSKESELPDTSVPNDSVDVDADGFDTTLDCDDENGAIYPGAAELCDGLDNNCDGVIDTDASDAPTWYGDADGDGYGDPASPEQACTQPSGSSSSGDDCDDENTNIHPGADEADCADPTDYNCDGSVGYADADGDGFAACEECDDTVYATHPGATEVCDTIDNDCDGEADVGAVDAQTWYQDLDGDGFGDPDYTTESCELPAGYTDNPDDCDHGDATINPDATEVCDGQDNDCDGVTDPDSSADASTWYTDADGDGYGDPSSTQQACEQPSKAVSNSGDCDDTEAAAYTGAAEICDEVDNNCDGSVDEGVESSWYLDSDKDGYGDPDEEELACSAPTKAYISSAGDCDDGDSGVNPAATETCDGADEDCDGTIDNDEVVLGESGCAATDCEDLLNTRSGLADGLYYIDPDGTGEGQVWCDMSLDSGGWTLLAVTSDDGTATWTWGNRRYWDTSTTTFGKVTALTKDYKSEMYHRLDFTDLLFVHSTPSSPSSPYWASYHSVGNGTYDLGTAIGRVSEKTVYGYYGGYTMSAGNLTSSSKLCTTNMAFNACGLDGGYTYCTDSDNTHGPTWNINNNNGCPWDDTNVSGGLGPGSSSDSTEYTGMGFAWALSINTGTSGSGQNNMRIYAR